jgi:hypothetical protein
LKLTTYYFRKWIEEYQDKIMGGAQTPIEELKIYESPKQINTKLL